MKTSSNRKVAWLNWSHCNKKLKLLKRKTWTDETLTLAEINEETQRKWNHTSTINNIVQIVSLTTMVKIREYWIIWQVVWLTPVSIIGKIFNILVQVQLVNRCSKQWTVESSTNSQLGLLRNCLQIVLFKLTLTSSFSVRIQGNS